MIGGFTSEGAPPPHAPGRTNSSLRLQTAKARSESNSTGGLGRREQSGQVIPSQFILSGAKGGRRQIPSSPQAPPLSLTARSQACTHPQRLSWGSDRGKIENACEVASGHPGATWLPRDRRAGVSYGERIPWSTEAPGGAGRWGCPGDFTCKGHAAIFADPFLGLEFSVASCIAPGVEKGRIQIPSTVQ